jgi:hypothetical protein
MRAVIVLAILGATLIAAAPPAEAQRNLRGGMVVTGHHHVHGRHFGFNRFSRAEQFAPFGFFDGSGWDYGPADYGYENPAVPAAPPVIPQLAPPAPPQAAASLPPCHEVTPAGVRIDRGMACNRVPP